MKKFLTTLVIGIICILPNTASANIRTPYRFIAITDSNNAQLRWWFQDSDGPAEGFRVEIAEVVDGVVGAFSEITDQDGNPLDTQATIDTSEYSDNALLQVRVTALNSSVGDSTPTDPLFIKKYPERYTEDFERHSLGSVDGQNGWVETGTLLPDMQIVDSGNEDGNVLRNTNGSYSYMQHKLTQGRTGENAKVRFKMRRIDPNDWDSPVIWIQGRSDRTEVSSVSGPKYGLQFQDFIGDQEMGLIGFDDSNLYFSVDLDYVRDWSFDYSAWHGIEIETIRVPNGLLVRGTLLDANGQIVDQINRLQTSERVTLNDSLGYFGISSVYSTFEVAEVIVEAEEMRVPPSAPTSVTAEPTEEGLIFDWDPSDLGGAEAPEGKYELLFEQVGGGVTQDFVTTETSFTRTDLNPESSYRLSIRAVNDEYQSPYVTSADMSPNPDRTSPTIQDKQITFVDNGTKAGSFRISWTTDEDSQGRVTYGFQENSTLGENSSNFSITGNTYGTSHSTVLTKLAPCTKYRGRIRVRDEANNLATSPFNFTTRGCAGNTEIEEESNDDVASTEEKEIELRDDTRLQAKIRVPQGASTRPNLNFQIKRLAKQTFIENVEIPESLEVIAEVVNLSALEDEDSSVSEFDEPIEVSIVYDDSGLTPEEEQELVIYRYGPVEWFACEPSGDCIPEGEEGFEGMGDRDGFWTPGEAWETLDDCTVDTDENTVTCTTTRFSSFTVMRLLGGGNDPQEESPSEETPVQNDTNQDATPQDISESIPEEQPNTYTNRPFASLSRAVSSRNLALNVIEEETARTNTKSDQDSDVPTEPSEQDEERTKREDQNKVAEEISNIEEEIRENPRTRLYLGITASGVLLLAIAVAWMSQRGKM